MSEQKVTGLVIMMPAMGDDGKPTEAQIEFQKALAMLAGSKGADANTI